MWPSPAATATCLCDTTQILPGNRAISMGNPIDGLTARTPLRSSAVTIVRAMSFTSSPAWWNSRFANRARGRTDRLAIHTHDEAHEPAGIREVLEDVVPVGVELGAIDVDEADVVGAGVERELAKPVGVQLFGGARS